MEFLPCFFFICLCVGNKVFSAHIVMKVMEAMKEEDIAL